MSRLQFGLGAFWRRRIGRAHRKPRVHPPVVAQADRLAEIHAGAFARPWTADEFERFLLDPAIRVDALFLGRSTRPSGFSVARLVLDEAEILSVALAREVRRCGYSRVLLAYHLQHLGHAGVRHVHLEVEEGNGPALALYRRAGFRESGLRPGYYARPDGSRADALSMTLGL